MKNQYSQSQILNHLRTSSNYVNLAIFDDSETGWKVFELANIRSYKLLPSAKKGFLKLKISKDIFDDEGTITQTESILYVNYTQFNKNQITIEEVSK